MPPERTLRPISGTRGKVTAAGISTAMKACDCYNERFRFVAITPNVPVRIAQHADLSRIVAIYNASIPGRAATADTSPVTVAQREPWFRDFDPGRRPLWVYVACTGEVDAWFSLRSFYGRPAYEATVETAVYVAPPAQGQGLGSQLLDHALEQAPRLGIRTMLAFIFGHNAPSLRLYERAGFERWGHLPQVAELDGTERDLSILGKRVA